MRVISKLLLGCKKNDFINILISLLKTIKQKENHQEKLKLVSNTYFSFKLENLDVYPAFGTFAETFLKTQTSFTKQRTVLEH